MYIKDLAYRNVGPLRYIDMDMPFTDNGCPKPLVVVGENGSGKSLFISNIVDSLIEAAAAHYSDVRPNDASNQYFKVISPNEVSLGEKYLAVHISFNGGEEYLFKSGDADFDGTRRDIHVESNRLDWSKSTNYKGTTFTGEKVKEYFSKGICCYFGPNRYETPSWMGDSYLDSPRRLATISADPRYSRNLGMPIVVQHCLSDTEKWLLDIVSDSRCDIEDIQDGSKRTMQINTRFLDSDRIQSGVAARRFAERILSIVLGTDVRLIMNGRRSGAQRLRVVTSDYTRVIAPSFSVLSTGQLALFDMFSTIVRYADQLTDDRSSISAESIEGIVVIDEADLHLHTALQRTALPELIAAFPRVQFIITTHSPLLLIGLEEKLGQDGFALIELPTGDRIGLEAFSEFQGAYDCYRDTKLHRLTVEEEVLRRSGLPLVITEGKTDWMHFKAARTALEAKQPTNGLTWEEFDFLEYSENMGGDELKAICKKVARVPQARPIIFVADSDKKSVAKDLCAPDGLQFKKHGNGVYSIVIPTPQYREKEDGICVEQLYPDDVLKAPVMCDDGIMRRLYLISEFDEFGRSREGYLWTGAGKSRRNASAVIDGDSTKVMSIDCSSNKNFALSKTAFAKFMLENAVEFNDNRFEEFVPVFSAICGAIRDWITCQGDMSTTEPIVN